MPDIKEIAAGQQNTMPAFGEYLAGEAAEHVGKEWLGIAVSPAIWFAKYQVSGETPGSTDVGLWGIGAVGTLGAGSFLAPAAAITGAVKGLMDDWTYRRVEEARREEPPEKRPGIFAVPGNGTPATNAMLLAQRGYTCWQHPNGVWVSIKDKKGHVVIDHKPARAVLIYRPMLPFKLAKDGAFVVTHQTSLR
jgi:hypothetical protein